MCNLHDLVTFLSELKGREMQPMMNLLLATYVLRGCDTVSYIFCQGKKKKEKEKWKQNQGLKIEGNFRSFASFGIVRASLELKPNVTKEAREFFVSLLDSDGFNSPDELREDAFAKCKGDIRRIPATEDAFYLYLHCTLCRLAIHMRPHLIKMDLAPPTDYDWQLSYK